MKRKLGRILCLLISICLLTGCRGNYETVGLVELNDSVELQDSVGVHREGVVSRQEIQRLKDENGIGNYSGEYEGYKYEWTIFGSDISEAKDMNLSLQIDAESEQGIKITFAEDSAFDFPVFLAIHLNEKWNSQGAMLYCEEIPIDSVSVTGSKHTILNIAVCELQGEYVIRANEVGELVDTENSQEMDSDLSETIKPVQDTQVQERDEYLSVAKDTSDRVYSIGTQSKKDKYETDPVPQGKPMPVEPEEQEINVQKSYTCTFSIECTTILNNLGDLDPDKLELVPSDGIILEDTEVTFYEGESVYDVLQRVCQDNGIHMESSWTPIYNSAYIEGIHNLYEFDCGELSGWMYSVNGWYPNYGCSRYQLVQGETVVWKYTCDLGRDVGCNWME